MEKQAKDKYSSKKYTKEQIIQNIEFATRLKKLREKHNLSHETLSAGIFKKCDIEISIKTLKNYEVIEYHHKNFGAAIGASLRNVLAIANYFEVSVDYLLGRAECTNITYEQIYNTMGLSEQTINRLIAIKKDTNSYYPNDKFTIIDVINLLFADKEYKLTRLLRHLLEYFKLAKFKKEINVSNKQKIKRHFDNNPEYSKTDERILLDFYLETSDKNIPTRKLNRLIKERDKKLSKFDEQTKINNKDLLELYKVIVASENDKLNEKLDFNLFYAQSYLKEIVQDIDIEALDIEKNEELKQKLFEILYKE